MNSYSDFAENLRSRRKRKSIEHGRDRALERILDRHNAIICFAAINGFEYVCKRLAGKRLIVGIERPLLDKSAHCHIAECPSRTKKRIRLFEAAHSAPISRGQSYKGRF